MSEAHADQALSLIRRLADRLNRRVSEIFALLLNHKNAGSLGALAGLAITVVFAWKFLRPPAGGRRRNVPKRRDSQAASDRRAPSNSVPSVDESPSTEASVKEFDAVELTPGQILKKKLSGCRKITIQLLGVVLEERTPEELQEHATVRQSVVEVLLEMAKYTDVYLMETVLDDESEERVLSALDSAGLFQTGGLVKDKVLFCSTEIGRSSFVRQLESDCHIDTNLEIISQLSRFIRLLVHISPEPLGQMASNIFSSMTLEQYFSTIG
ncbi:peroxisome biogenesis protein 22-like [Dioscorea cayenensis subsp. rotundata]|uniref:Peroxisome biogenesis protein 22-like n=1 Tax=Dioscorea cayennensis subsp. rotundata TaxID=55577 RepID=A0AB40C4I5_DIOCR|nr:peroxisome biogenesis protein 22-like [Dioscorea cayenensis subsp. rotundata]